jgi:hypothetical protein
MLADRRQRLVADCLASVRRAEAAARAVLSRRAAKRRSVSSLGASSSVCARVCSAKAARSALSGARAERDKRRAAGAAPRRAGAVRTALTAFGCARNNVGSGGSELAIACWAYRRRSSSAICRWHCSVSAPRLAPCSRGRRASPLLRIPQAPRASPARS